MAEIEKPVGDTLYTVVKCVADRIPQMRSRTMRIRKDKYSTEHDCFFGLSNLKVSHLGWTAYRLSLVSPEQNWRHHSIGMSNWAWYRASWSMDSTRPCSSLGKSCQIWQRMMMPEGHLWGHPTMEQAIGSPVTSSLTREACGPCWEMSLQDEHDLFDDDLKHDPAREQETGWVGC